jgi:hypothetical protein
MPNLFIITVIALTVASGEAGAQAARAPVGLRLTFNSAEARLGAKVPVTVGLKNFKGEPDAATERVDVALESNLPATLERVTIPVGKDSAATVIVFKRAGTV